MRYLTITILALNLALPLQAQGASDAGLLLGCGLFGVVGCLMVVAAVLISAFWLWLAARWTHLDERFGTAVKAVLLVALFGLIFNLIASGFLSGFEPSSFVGAVIFANLIVLLIGGFAVRVAYSTTFPRALLTYIVSQLISLVVVVALFVVVALGLGALTDVDMADELRQRWQELETRMDEASQSRDDREDPRRAPREDTGEDAGRETPETTGEESREAAEEVVRTAVSKPLGQASSYVGRRVQVILIDTSTISGTLEEVRADRLIVRRKIEGGTITLPVMKARIREFQLLVRTE